MKRFAANILAIVLAITLTMPALTCATEKQKKDGASPTHTAVTEDSASNKKQPAGEGSTGPELPEKEFVKIIPGLYSSEYGDMEFSAEEDGFTGSGSLKTQLDLKQDNTFFMTEYATVEAAQIENKAIYKARGNWRQEGNKLVISDILEQFYDTESEAFLPWESPGEKEKSTTVKIRNVTPGTFQEFDEDADEWITWVKM